MIKKAEQVAWQHRDEVLGYISHIEWEIANKVAEGYAQVANVANRYGGSHVTPDHLPNHQELLDLGQGILGTIEYGKNSGMLDQAFSSIISTMRAAGVPNTQTPSKENLEMLVTGLIHAGKKDLEWEAEQ